MRPPTGFVLVAVIGLWACPDLEPDVLPCPQDGTLGACCSAESPCEAGLSCSLVEEVPVCTAPCAASDEPCPAGSTCIDRADEAVCLPDGGLVGDLCNPAASEGCRPGLICLGESGQGACTAVCSAEHLCPSKELVGERLCTLLSEDAGTYCLRPCAVDADCATGMVCTEVVGTGRSVCFPDFSSVG